ncbi:MAG TPA: GAF domain-containing protein, partial [Anaerolineales bacterium]|nr:GAF domain-containing protein [Anaerolineales bacterium]
EKPVEPARRRISPAAFLSGLRAPRLVVPAEEEPAVEEEREREAREIPATILAARITNIRARLMGSLFIILAAFLLVGILYAVSFSRLDRVVVGLEEEIWRADWLAAEQQAAVFAEIEAVRRVMREAPVAWGMLVVTAAVSATFITLRSIAQPLERTTEATTRLAAGHLEERLPAEWAGEFGQLAAAFNEMAERLQASYTDLERQVAERTRALQEANYALQRRAVQLEASFEVGRAITSIFDVDQLLRRTVELIRDRFGFYHAGIFLLDEAGEWAVLREATGEAGAQMKAQGHRLALGSTSMVGWTALHRQPRIALDVGEDAVHFANPLLPYTRSEMTLPLMVGGRLLGVLDVQSTEEAAFDEDDVRALQNMANQIAVAIENARRISEEAALLEATSPIYRASRRLTMAMSAEEVVEVIADLVRETGVDGCIVALAEPYGAEEPEMFHFVSSWRRDRESPIRPGTRLPVSAFHMRPEALQNLWMETSVATADRLSKEEKVFFRRAGVQSVAHIPLRIGDRQLGFVVAYRVMPGGFADGALRLYEALSDQASVALERVWLLEITRQRAEEEAALRAIGDRIARAVDVETVLYSAAEGLREAIRAEGICIELGPGVVAEDLEPVGASGG